MASKEFFINFPIPKEINKKIHKSMVEVYDCGITKKRWLLKAIENQLIKDGVIKEVENEQTSRG